MGQNRRDFLKAAGLGTLGALWGIPVVKAVGQAVGEVFEQSPAALQAKRWAMAIDLKRVAREDVRRAAAEACHAGHNVPQIGIDEEDIRWIWTEDFESALPDHVDAYTPEQTKQQPVPVLCNHCDNPPCVRVCPTQATWKRESDGIVMMDMHRCIGCRYCIAACPYGSRSFNWRDPRPYIRRGIRIGFPTRSKGVVEKCNFCAERLARGEQPLCVEAANRVGGAGTMAFGDLADPRSAVSRLIRSKHTIRRKMHLGTSPQVYYVV